MGFLLLPAPALLIVAVLPACYVLWIGRRLAPRVDDAMLPEKLAAEAPHRALVLALAMAVILTTAGRHLLWAFPLLVVSRIAAAFPLRRAIYGETWSLAAYVSFFLRLGIGFYGFWLLLAATPALMTNAGGNNWMVAAVLTPLLLFWQHYYPDVLRWLMKSTPVADPALKARFERLVEKAGLPSPLFEQVIVTGGVFANAVALPSLRRSGVLVSETLLARLDPDEIIAVCAHELAHLEHYNPQHMRSLRSGTIALIVLTAVLTPAAQRLFPDATFIVLLVWGLTVLAMLLWRARDRQKQETESDLRAVALTGDPEALVRALTKLHLIARVPRRLEQEMERHATHPSLARRIQSIRGTSTVSPAAPAPAVTVMSSDGRRSATFEGTQLVWKEGDSSTFAFGYGDLKELRLSSKAGKAPTLIAVDVRDRRWELAVREEDVARANEALNVVDTKLALPAVRQTSHAALVRLLGVIVLALTWCTGHIAAGIAALLVLGKPLAAVNAAAAAAGLTAATLVLRDGIAAWNLGSGFDLTLAAALILCGGALLAFAIARRDEEGGSALKPTAALGACAAVMWISVLLYTRDLVSFHRALRDVPAAVVFTIATGTALAFVRTRAAQWTAAWLLAIGVTGIALGSMTFRDHFVHDPFLTAAEPLSIRTLPDTPDTTFSVPFYASGLRLSPLGTHVALSTEDVNERVRFHVGPAGGELREFDADEAIFLDEDRVLFLDLAGETAVLREWNLQSAQMSWEKQIPEVREGRLWFDPERQRWDFVAMRFGGGIVGVHGQAGGSTIVERQWRTRETASSPLLVSGPTVLLARPETGLNLLQNTPVWLWALAFSSQMTTTNWHFEMASEDQLHDAFSSRVEANCPPGLSHDAMAVCYAFDGVSTRFLGVGATGSPPVGIASMDGRFISYGSVSADWIGGWWDYSSVAVSLKDRTLWRVGPNFVCRCSPQLSASGRFISAISQDPRGSKVYLFTVNSSRR